MNAYQFADARSLFEAAREATIEITRNRNILREMEAGEGVRGANIAGIGHAPGVSDPYLATDRRIDFEAMKQADIAEDEALIDYACAVLYGRDQMGRTGGLYTLAPHACADVICLHWCMGAKWEEVTRRVKYSKSHAQRLAAQGFDVIDAYGIEATIEGVGNAT